MPNPINGPSPRSVTPRTPASPTPAPAAPEGAQGWTPANRTGATSGYRSPIADGALSIPLTVNENGRSAPARLVATVKSHQELSDSPQSSGKNITVQTLSDVRVEVNGKRYRVLDDALNAALRTKGVQMDAPFSSQTDVTSKGLFGFFSTGVVVGLGAQGFELRKSDNEYYHRGEVALAHPDRVY